MERTRNRPLPAKQISVRTAWIATFIFGFSGCLLLYFYGGLVPLLLGLFNIAWYNGFYTWFKKINVFAVVPGSLVGAIPPVIGWTAAGGNIFSEQILILSGFLFLWQVPHFWMLQVRFADDYKKAGFPVLSDKISVPFIALTTVVWLIASSMSTGLFILYHLVNSIFSYIIIFVSVVMICVISVFLVRQRELLFKKPLIFIVINAFMIIIMFTLIIGNLT
jgi:protoheme IX farnesyltransferase